MLTQAPTDPYVPALGDPEAIRKSRSVLERVLRFTTEVGLPITWADIGLMDLPKADLNRIAIRATAENDTMHNEPFQVRPDMVADAIMAADALGRAWKKRNGGIAR